MIGGIHAAIARFTADGAHDTRAIYEALAAVGAPGPAIVREALIAVNAINRMTGFGMPVSLAVAR